MNRPLFSIITPVNLWSEERREFFYRALKSVINQTFKDFEYIIINDGSSLEFEIPSWVRVITVPHGERVIALWTGMKKAKGEWFCFLDYDDEYKKNYLEFLKGVIEYNPDYKMFNFGCEYHYKDETTTTREPFKPIELKVGHEVFGGGNIVNGTFILHRSVYKDLGGFPSPVVRDVDCTEINYPAYQEQEKPYIRDLFMNTPYDFSAYYQIKYPEIRHYFMVDFEGEPNKIIKELGDPWGNDFALFYQYTRKYHSKPIYENLLVVHPKGSN